MNALTDEVMDNMSNLLNDTFRYVEANRDSFVARLLQYLRQPTISAQNIGIREGVELAAEAARGAGLTATICETTSNPVMVAKSEFSPDRKTVMFYGHFDVQPPEPLSLWTNPPFEPTIRDGRIYARGVADNKGQHLAQLLAIESMTKVNGGLPCNVIVVLDGEEEIGSAGLPGFVRQRKDELRCDLVITADGAMPKSEVPVIYFGVRGLAGFEMRIRHARSDLHSGGYGNIAPNPLWTMVHLLASMKDDEGNITIDGFHDRIRDPEPAALEAARQLPIDEAEVRRDLGIDRFDDPVDLPYYHRTMFRPSMTINGLHGGYGGDGAKTVLPSEAVAKCDFRLIDDQDPEEILDLAERHARARVPTVEFIRQQRMQPSTTPLSTPYTAALRNAIVAARGQEPLLYPRAGGSLPDYVFTKLMATPIYLIPYGNWDQANHAPNENMKVDNFMMGIRTGVALLEEIGKLG